MQKAGPAAWGDWPASLARECSSRDLPHIAKPLRTAGWVRARKSEKLEQSEQYDGLGVPVDRRKPVVPAPVIVQKWEERAIR